MPLEFLHPSWNAHSRVRALVTTRLGGVSRGPYAELNLGTHLGDSARAVADNRARLEEASRPIQWLDQRHGNQVFEATLRCSTPPVADALWTTAEGLGLGILTADCFPVFLTDAGGTVVGLAHCGWKPLVSGVLANLVQAMPGRGSDLMAWIGPGISLGSYQVGEDFVARLRGSQSDPLLEGVLHYTNGQVRADLEQLIRNQLALLGVSVASERPPCTHADRRFFSHRRDGPNTGRFGSVIWLATNEC